MPGSLKANYIFNLLNTVLGLLFPLITFPYAARVVMADGIGQVNFFSSIISYISLFTCLGIPMYAIREIARVRDDKKKVKYNHYRDTFIAYRAYDFGLFCRGCSLYDYYESQGRYSSFFTIEYKYIFCSHWMRMVLSGG